MGALKHSCCWLLIAMMLTSVQCFDQQELDMYDLIEELGMKPNFYEILDVGENSTSMEIRRTFRQLSLIHHPDKSDAADADVKFRRLVAVYEILRDKEKRALYDKYLIEGLPDWRSIIYYYRHARRMGMLEIAIILCLITTVGQYLTSWAAYKEKQLAVEDAVRVRFKRERKAGKDVDYDDMVEKCMEQFPRPSMWNTLPCQSVRAGRWLVTRGPWALADAVRAERERREEERLAVEREQQEREEAEAEQQRQREKRQAAKERRRQRAPLPEGKNEEIKLSPRAHSRLAPAPAVGWSTARSGPWLDEDLVELAKLVKKHPPGTPERWEVIAEALERTVAEVTKMARMIRDKPHMVPVSSAAQMTTADGLQVSDSVLEPQAPRKVKTRAEAASGAAVEDWSQPQQRALELALAQFPKGAAERWERVAKVVPGKTKEECMLRFKFLAEQLKRRKEEESKEKTEEPAENNGPSPAVVASDQRCSQRSAE